MTNAEMNKAFSEAFPLVVTVDDIMRKALEMADEIERLRKKANSWQALAHRFWKEEPEDCECRACEVYEELEVQHD